MRAEAAAQPIPVLVGFRERILPLLGILWGVAVAAFLLTGKSYIFPVAVWATVTLIMLWPVGTSLDRPYSTYRSPLFILGVISMAYIIFAGFAMESDWSFAVKSIIFFGLVFDLTIFGILPGLRRAISRPVRMFFRPDLLFGDGRVLCCGIIATVLGMRYIIGKPPPSGQLWPIPIWDWWAILFAMLAGFIPMIPVRGVMKLLMRMARMRWGTWEGWGGVILKESVFILTALGIGFGFHHAFMGKVPFTVPVRAGYPGFWTALGITLLSALFLIFVRGGYKKSIGEPFILERTYQTFLKQLLLVAGIVPLFYGFMSILIGDLRGLNTGPTAYVGLVFFFWGLLVLIPFRVLIQINQRGAILSQMVAVILPSFAPEERERLLWKMMNALCDTTESVRLRALQAMLEGLAAAPEEVRRLMTAARVSLLVRLPPEKRKKLVRSSASALGRMRREERVASIADMMAAAAELPQKERRLMMDEMAAVMS